MAYVTYISGCIEHGGFIIAILFVLCELQVVCVCVCVCVCVHVCARARACVCVYCMFA